MDFSVDMLHTMEKELQSSVQEVLKAVKITSSTELNHTMLMKLNKDPLATFVKNLLNLFDNNLDLCKSAANKIDQLKTEQIENQKELIKMQQDQMKSVHETVKTEIKSWADVVKKNSNQSMNMTVKTVKEAVISAVAEDDKSRNFMIYGLEEANEGIEEDLEDAVQATMEKTGTIPYPAIRSIRRLGVKRSDLKPRPVRVQLACAYQVQRMLKAAHRLRNYEGEFRSVYLAPDRSKEERVAHSKLVSQMKELIQQDSSKHYFIRNNKVNCVDKRKPLSSGRT